MGFKRRLPLSSRLLLVHADGAQCLPDKLVWAQPNSESLFGNSVALSGNWAVIGARQASHGGFNQAGVAVIFERSPSGWQAIQPLLQTVSPGTNYQFGSAVAIDGDVVVVGEWDAGGTGRAWVVEQRR